MLSHLRALFYVELPAVRHTNPLVKAIYWISGLGHQAVMVFFILSGFFIVSQIQRARESNRWSWGKYSIARLSRLYVALIPALCLGLMWDLWGSHLSGGAQIYHAETQFHHVIPANIDTTLNAPTFLGNLAFLQTIFVPTLGSNGPLWSLSNEFWYYAIFPLIFFGILGFKKSGLGSAALVLVAAALFFMIGSEERWGFGVWLLGASLVWLPSGSYKNGKLIAIVGGVLFAAALFASKVMRMGYVLEDYSVGIPFWIFCIGILQMDPNSKTPKLYANTARHLSSISYTLYLVHLPLLTFIAAAFIGSSFAQPSLKSLLMGVGLTVIVLFYAAVLWWLFERNTDKVRAILERKCRV